MLTGQADGTQILVFEGKEVTLPNNAVWHIHKDPSNGDYLIDGEAKQAGVNIKPKWVKHLIASKKARVLLDSSMRGPGVQQELPSFLLLVAGVLGLGSKVSGLGCKVSGLGAGVQGSWVWGSSFMGLASQIKAEFGQKRSFGSGPVNIGKCPKTLRGVPLKFTQNHSKPLKTTLKASLGAHFPSSVLRAHLFLRTCTFTVALTLTLTLNLTLNSALPLPLPLSVAWLLTLQLPLALPLPSRTYPELNPCRPKLNLSLRTLSLTLCRTFVFNYPHPYPSLTLPLPQT